jgi:hypothetical protein
MSDFSYRHREGADAPVAIQEKTANAFDNPLSEAIGAMALTVLAAALFRAGRPEARIEPLMSATEPMPWNARSNSAASR